MPVRGSMEFAKPGDPDLDLDLNDLTVSTYSRLGNEYIISFSGGSGKWIDPDTHEWVNIAEVTEFSADVKIIDPKYCAMVEESLSYLAANKTPLRCLAAPGQYTTFMAGEEIALILPRSS